MSIWWERERRRSGMRRVHHVGAAHWSNIKSGTAHTSSWLPRAVELAPGSGRLRVGEPTPPMPHLLSHPKRPTAPANLEACRCSMTEGTRESFASGIGGDCPQGRVGAGTGTGCPLSRSQSVAAIRALLRHPPPRTQCNPYSLRLDTFPVTPSSLCFGLPEHLRCSLHICVKFYHRCTIQRTGTLTRLIWPADAELRRFAFGIGLRTIMISYSYRGVGPLCPL